MIDTGNSRSVSSNQSGIHDRLDELVLRYQKSAFKRPYSEHTLQAFEQASEWLAGQNRPLILDSCCGIGESSLKLASLYPDSCVMGVDRSEHRLSKHDRAFEPRPHNLLLVQADLVDFWRLAVVNGWSPTHHFILYPNPYPKATHVQRRWHASPVFNDLIKLGGKLEVRSNWEIYIQELSRALALYNKRSTIEVYEADEAWTAFERKYWASGQETWSCRVNLG